jgi:hypothetical protein
VPFGTSECVAEMFLSLNCWVLHPVACVSTNTDSTDLLTYTVVALNIFLCTFYLKMVTDRGRNML